ncbi:36.4 kDa proline-rich protein [Papilio machaon]|uniref:36.4 kDa proline-rich protein n=1 Tax=Papilio machaon TaxID=76193 RepID=UPI001E664FEA|nr:36.4 kDa proline-rich protein [Papilio machaon]
MKYFAVFALLAVASAAVLPPSVVVNNPEVQEILASIQSPTTDPATAAALEQLLLEVLGIAKPEPIQVGPAIVDEYEPIHVGPAIVGEPIHVGPAIIDEYEPIHVGPAIVDEQEVAPVIPAPSAQSPLVQIILKINVPTNVPGSPVVVETVPPAPTPVQVVEEAAVAEPVIVVDQPVVPEPVIVAPVLPSPVVVLPDILN